MDKPRYFDSWKGRIVKAIVHDNARSWFDLIVATGLGAKSLNKVIAEMLSAGALEKKDEIYRLEYELYKEYRAYDKTVSTQQRNVDKIKPKMIRKKYSDGLIHGKTLRGPD